MMFFTIGEVDGVPVHVVVRERTLERLADTCFRSTDLALAGNFAQWEEAEALFWDPSVRDPLTELVMGEIGALLEEGLEESDTSFTVTVDNLHGPIGWESTMSFPPVQLEVQMLRWDLEQRKLNRHATALFVTNREVKAPRTNEVTFVTQIRFEREGERDNTRGDQWVVVVHSIYPGVDVGELDGDVTQREGRVFFDWNHPGEPLPNSSDR